MAYLWQPSSQKAEVLACRLGAADPAGPIQEGGVDPRVLYERRIRSGDGRSSRSKETLQMSVIEIARFFYRFPGAECHVGRMARCDWLFLNLSSDWLLAAGAIFRRLDC